MSAQKVLTTTGLVIPSGKQISTSSGIDPVVVNKLIIDSRTKFYIYARPEFCLQKTLQ